eukprot:SAG31_NODE_21580_length_546_cov_0.675615_1_plen_113_part_10
MAEREDLEDYRHRCRQAEHRSKTLRAQNVNLANEAKRLQAENKALRSQPPPEQQLHVFELQIDDLRNQLTIAQQGRQSLTQENRILYEENAKMAELLEAMRRAAEHQVGCLRG